MRKIIAAILLIVPVTLAGCGTTGGTAALGTVGGAAAGGGLYEYRLHQEMNRIEDEHKSGKMDDKEYNARKDSVRRVQVIQ